MATCRVIFGGDAALILTTPHTTVEPPRLLVSCVGNDPGRWEFIQLKSGQPKFALTHLHVLKNICYFPLWVFSATSTSLEKYAVFQGSLWGGGLGKWKEEVLSERATKSDLG